MPTELNTTTPTPPAFGYRVVCIEKDLRTTKPWNTIAQNINPTHRFFIPDKWPTPQVQLGYTCGFLALSIALTFAGIQAPPAEPNPANPASMNDSLLSHAKKLELTTVGEIFSITNFSLLLNTLGISNYKAVLSNANKFLTDICAQLDKSHTVVTSSNLAPTSDFPAENAGSRPHWVLIFGYFHSQSNKLQFLVTQYNRFYIWPAEDLLASNNIDPSRPIPCCKKFGGYINNESGIFFKSNEELKQLKKEKPHQLASLQTIPNKRFGDFGYSIFSISSNGSKPDHLRREREEVTAAH